MFSPIKININKTGLTLFLGDLEAIILELAWIHKRVTIREFCRLMESRNKKLSFNTVMTVANRMVKKELLKKEIGVKEYFYSPAEDKEVFTKRIQQLIASQLKNLKIKKVTH